MLSPISSSTSMGKPKPRVYKARGFGCDHCRPVLEEPWAVSAPYWPHKTFATWDEAIAYALTWRQPIMINSTAA